jgi:oxygen tolerance protein BatD
VVKRRFLLLLILCSLLQPSWAQVIGNDRVSSTLSHQSIGLDETATLTITVKGVNDVMDVGTPAVRPSTGIQMVGVGRQFSMSTINGRTETMTKFNFLITPLEKGRYIIDPVTVVVNGVAHETTSHRLEVTDALGRGRQPQSNYPGGPMNPWGVYPHSPSFRIPSDPVAPPRRPQGEDFILEAELEPETVYKHEPAVYNLRLLTAVRLMRDPRYSPILPTGLISVSFPQESSQEYRDGRGYSVTEAKTAFFPLTEGEYEFPASEIALSTGIFGNTRTMRTEPKTLKVLPLPTEGRPTSFTGAVGENFELSASVDKSMVKAGETVELKIAAYGEGNLDLVPYPYLPNWQGVEKKQANGTSHVNAKDGKVTSQRTYIFRIKMTQPGSYNLDNIALAYFRPSVERYEVLKAPSVSVEVLAGSPTTDQTESGATGASKLSEEDAPRTASGPVEPTAGRLELSQLLMIGGVALLGFILGFAQPSLKGPRLSWGGLRSKPKDLTTLEKAMTEVAPGADRIAREEQLAKLGFGAEEISDFESLKHQVASKRYGSDSSQTGVEDLIDSFQALLRRVKS